MNKRIYRVEVEVEPMEGTQLPSDCVGAFVDVYLGSSNIIDAIRIVESELLQDCFKPVKTYAAFELNLDETDFDVPACRYLVKDFRTSQSLKSTR